MRTGLGAEVNCFSLPVENFDVGRFLHLTDSFWLSAVDSSLSRFLIL